MSDNKAALSAFREEVSAWMSENVPSDPGFLLPLTFLEVGTELAARFSARVAAHTLERGLPGHALAQRVRRSGR